MASSKVLTYTFYNWNNLTYKIVRELDMPGLDLHKYYLGNLKSLCKNIVNEKHDYILGFGDYRKDSKKIRVEKKFVNKYGQSRISRDGRDFYESNWILDLDKEIKYELYETRKGSWGPCNRSGYKILETLDLESLSGKFAFVHIPGELDKNKVLKLIKDWLSDMEV